VNTPPVDDEITIGSFFKTLVKFVQWCVLAFAIGYGGFWLFVPTLRHNVRHVEGPGPKPSDCEFMTAPLGNKGCHYEMQRMLIDAQGNYIATVNWFNSHTDGKTDNPNAKPDTMVCTWEKVQD
jgi:hypothetical protein